MVKKLILLLLLAVAVAAAALALRSAAASAPPADGQQTFFEQFVVAGGPVVWFVLLPMSVLTVYLAVELVLTIRRGRLLPAGSAAATVEVLGRFGPGRFSGGIGSEHGLVGAAIASAIDVSGGNWLRTRNLAFESIQEQSLALLRRIEWLNLIGNVSPMVGLFGTVFGMIKLFNSIVLAGGQPQPAQLADGISVALVTTFWGLSIAIPALAIHGVLRSRLETLAGDAVAAAEKVIPEINRKLELWQRSGGQRVAAGSAAEGQS
jgi:biopolymer transport protein ExbB